MNWQELKIHVEREQALLLESVLEGSGALSVYMDDAADQPLLEPLPGETPLWDQIIVTGLFDAEADLTGLSDFIRTTFKPASMTLTALEEQVWERAWMDHYEPIQCGPGLWIVPEWLSPPDPAAVNVRMDPGLAFGTGTHASTYLCLDWLAGQNLKDKTVIDYGCGSGILGVAALMLGAKKVYAVDIDPQAILATQQNASLNGVEDRLWCGLPEEFNQLSADPASMVIANILAKPLMELASHFYAKTAPQAQIVLAGLIEEQVTDIQNSYRSYFLLDEIALREENWCRLAGTRL